MTRDHAKKRLREPRGLTEAQLDEAIEETFPASDPAATSPMSIGGPDRSRDRSNREPGKPLAGRR